MRGSGKDEQATSRPASAMETSSLFTGFDSNLRPLLFLANDDLVVFNGFRMRPSGSLSPTLSRCAGFVRVFKQHQHTALPATAMQARQTPAQVLGGASAVFLASSGAPDGRTRELGSQRSVGRAASAMRAAPRHRAVPARWQSGSAKGWCQQPTEPQRGKRSQSQSACIGKQGGHHGLAPPCGTSPSPPARRDRAWAGS